ncbi:MAG: prepilin-type N-terminal cleavage/methylation domain-containing protein [Synergistaceae bacterium]|jgi:prepilin-type N-terminal cleavage/methylation domain-containing protein|nr:prepilin-type N-terminal cleavage/methylation domain-containing protein [Synergistaceae bacterium]
MKNLMKNPMQKPGFSLVELLLALVLSSTVGMVVLQTARTILFSTVRMSNNALAWERGQNVLSILEPRVLHAGFGIACERAGNLFQRSFGRVTDGPPPATWSDRGPVQVWRGLSSDTPTLWDLAPETDGVCRGRGLALLYAVPSGLSAKLPENRPLPMTPGASVTVELLPSENLQANEDRLTVTAKNDLRSWVAFPLVGFPVHMSLYDKRELTVALADEFDLSPATLRPYDDMYYLRADRFQVKNNRLYSEELHSSWVKSEPRIEGVLEMWFEWTPSKSRLEAWILTTGGKATFGKTARPKEWPAQAPWRAEFALHDLTVARGSWILKNM